MSQELSYTFEEFNLIMREILDSENLSHGFQEHFNIDWNSPLNGLRWNLNTYKCKPYVPIETFIDIVLAVTFKGLTVTILALLLNPAGTVVENAPPSTLYVQVVIVVLDAFPVIEKLVLGCLTPFVILMI